MNMKWLSREEAMRLYAEHAFDSSRPVKAESIDLLPSLPTLMTEQEFQHDCAMIAGERQGFEPFTLTERS